MSPTRILLCCVAVAASAVLAACGGGSAVTPSVTTMQAANARYANTSVITVAGANLRQGLRVEVEGPCENVLSAGTGTDDAQQYTCEVREIGEFVVTVYDSDGRAIGRLAATVPPPEVTVTTAQGSFAIQLDPVSAPQGVRGFLGYVNAGFYRSTLVHRAVKDALIEAGGFNTGLVAKAANRAAIALESQNGLKNLRGAVALGRSLDVGAASALWFVNLRDNPDRDYVDAANPGYTVIGKVVSGLPVVEAMSAVPTKIDTTSRLEDVPVTEILITGMAQTR